MTFHQKVEEAAAFAEKLPQTAAELYVTEASDEALAAADRLPKSSIDAEFYELEAGRHVPPDRVWSAWLCGDHLVSERREVLRQFAGGIDAAGRRVHRAFLASCRVLGEGVDITGERGVEVVCLPTPAAPKSRSCRTSAGPCGSTATAPRRSPGSSCPSPSSPARTRPTWSPPPASAPWTVDPATLEKSRQLQERGGAL